MFAPEIFQGGVFSKESDIYSLGMVMWELTTGRKPFFNIEERPLGLEFRFWIIKGNANLDLDFGLGYKGDAWISA
ncbi:kinase-like domain-containing protein [Rhizophagus irregularis DAOM 181602=DAOM 197198]|nr:kinase-like domain-containing protein [Rhizophagus irregularis DAOM 181602=DAOM 197198]